VVDIHSRFSTADIDRIVQFHRTFVADYYGLDEAFQSQVRGSLTVFMDDYNNEKDCLWLAEVQGQLVGTIGIMHENGSVARVRWFLVHLDYRAGGLEKEVLEQAISFCQGKYSKVYLLAATLFERLAPLAKAAGFKKVEERQLILWGQAVTDERYELELPKDLS
jgi:RimJ/RimL family protein N-acetyltransferase